MNPSIFFLAFTLGFTSYKLSPVSKKAMLADLASLIDDLVQGISAVLMGFLQDMVMHFNKVEIHRF